MNLSDFQTHYVAVTKTATDTLRKMNPFDVDNDQRHEILSQLDEVISMINTAEQVTDVLSGLDKAEKDKPAAPAIVNNVHNVHPPLIIEKDSDKLKT